MLTPFYEMQDQLPPSKNNDFVRYDSWTNWVAFFAKKFGTLPNVFTFDTCDIKLANLDKYLFIDWQAQKNITGQEFSKNYYQTFVGDRWVAYCQSFNIAAEICSKQGVSNDSQYCDLLLFYCKDTPEIKNLIEHLSNCCATSYISKKRDSSISLLCCNQQGYYLTEMEMSKFDKLDLELNYGTKFLAVHKLVKNFLDGNNCGLCLLHGEIGSGKTTYIKHLLSICKQKVIYIPSHLMQKISDPDFVTFMLQNPDSVLVVEDAEEVVRDREDSNNPSVVANLLNVADGILGEALKTKVICTFNTDLKNVDRAITRKGRMAVQYKFEKLPEKEANILLERLGKKHRTDIPMSLAEIYNVDYDNLAEKEEKRAVGFK